MNRRQVERVATFINARSIVPNGRAVVEALIADGWTIQRAETVRRAYDRVMIAEHREQWADAAAESARSWAHEAFREQRRLAERCTFLYGAAIAAGATPEELNHP